MVQPQHLRPAPANRLGAALLILAVAGAAMAAAPIAPSVDDLYAADPAVRAAAQRRWLGVPGPDLAALDPRHGPCQQAAPPARCQRHADYLAQVVDILARRAAREASSAAMQRPAIDLLFAMRADPAVDAFAGPSVDPGRAQALRQRADRALRAALALPASPTPAQAAAAAVATASDERHRWHVLQACAGQFPHRGCRFGSYLFDAHGRLQARGVIEIEAADNPGGGVDEWHLALLPERGPNRLGVALTRGGFGGDVDRVVLRRLSPRLSALCALRLPRSSDGPAPAELLRLADHRDGRCQWAAWPQGAEAVDLDREPKAPPTRMGPSMPVPTPR